MASKSENSFKGGGNGGVLKFKDYMKAYGPAAIMAASIVGPGTVTTASVMGATYQYQAIWILAVACIAAYFFQEPAIRLTLNKGLTLFEGIRGHISNSKAVSEGSSGFLYLAVILGAIAFNAGNYTGAALAMNYMFPGLSTFAWAVIIGLLALAVAWLGVYKIVENANRILIGMMVLAFVLTAFVSGPSIGDVFVEGFSFQIPGDDYWLVLALLATTMPPNIPLSFSAFVKSKYWDQIKAANQSSVHRNTIRLQYFDLRSNMVITALITVAIIICAGAVIYPLGITITSAADMAIQLSPLLGRFAGVLFALGLFAAGFSSGLFQISVQPLLMNEAFGWERDTKAVRSRVIMLVAGVLPIILVWVFDAVPVALIVGAQVFNGLALPLVTAMIWKLSNRRDWLGEFSNDRRQNITYGVIMVLVSVLAIRVFLNIFGII